MSHFVATVAPHEGWRRIFATLALALLLFGVPAQALADDVSASGEEVAGAAESEASLERVRLLRALIPLAVLVSIVLVFLGLELRRRNRGQKEADAHPWSPPATRGGTNKMVPPRYEPAVGQGALASGELEVVASDTSVPVPHLFAQPAVLECPECAREFDALLGNCPFDGAELVSVERSSASQAVDSLDTSTTHMACPSCVRVFELGSKFCPFDGDLLVQAEVQDAEVRADCVMVCPECNDEYDRNAAFCSRDQTRLVAKDPQVVEDDERYLSLVPMMVCTSCATEYPVGQSTCQACEHPLSFMHGRRTAGLDIHTGADLHNICPECGSRYPSDLSFCCEDGKPLVTVN